MHAYRQPLPVPDLYHFHASNTAIWSFHDNGLASLDQNVNGGSENCWMEVFKLLTSGMATFNELIKRQHAAGLASGFDLFIHKIHGIIR